jgi:adenylosuccinate synthase
MIETATAVIGANYGDEGKGLVSCNRAEERRNSLTVFYNGGFQRSHTINYLGIDYPCRITAAGFVHGSHTYYAPDFVIEPVSWEQFRNDKTFRDLCDRSLGGDTKILVSSKCRITTPYDILLGHAREKSLKHGSCGLGIYQTIVRDDLVPFRVEDAFGVPEDKFYEKCDQIYEALRLTGYDKSILDEIKNSTMIDSFAVYCDMMKDRVEIITDENELCDRYDHVIFEGAQGLRLSKEYFDKDKNPHCTPSHTGIKGFIDSPLWQKAKSKEIIYVSRAYLTRHGNGPLENEATIEELNEKGFDISVDQTNVENEWQGKIRYAEFDNDFSYIENDLKLVEELYETSPTGEPIMILPEGLGVAFVLTHCNEAPKETVDHILSLAVDPYEMGIFSSYDKTDIRDENEPEDVAW